MFWRNEGETEKKRKGPGHHADSIRPRGTASVSSPLERIEDSSENVCQQCAEKLSSAQTSLNFPGMPRTGCCVTVEAEDHSPPTVPKGSVDLIVGA